ncbi:response regulator transcription factor [Cryomorphaceae bacterium]|nr:response regulator transcription factor [Cryomorphaceae bacterium]
MAQEEQFLIIEDEPHAQRELMRLIGDLESNVSMTAGLESVEDAVEYLQNNPAPDLIFMDIQLSDGLSFEIFDQVEVKSPVIFTTAYDQFALQAFGVYSVDYLLKPVEKDKLAHAIEKYRMYFEAPAHSTPMYKELVHALRHKEVPYKKRMVGKVGQRLRHYKVEDIAYFYAEDDTVFLRDYEGRNSIVEYNLEKLTEILDPELFFRISRKIIVSMTAMEKIERYGAGQYMLELNPAFDERVLVSRSRTKEFLQWMDQ